MSGQLASPVRHRLARNRGPAAWLTLTALVVVAVVILIPFALIALNAFKPPAEYSAHGPLSFPDGFYTGGSSSSGTPPTSAGRCGTAC